MAIVQFSKWQGTGNDFILIDDRGGVVPADMERIAKQLCDRHFGVGSDGLILLRNAEQAGVDYSMDFLNPDGSRSFCGNGSRCAFAFRSALALDGSPVRFAAIDGLHVACWVEDEVEVSMRDVMGMERVAQNIDFLDTGSPHLVIWTDDPAKVDLVPEARAHRYGPRFAKEGVNVNFVRWHNGHLEMRTYERGVEAETLSCGTGVTAAALSAFQRGIAKAACQVVTAGGALHVRAEQEGPTFKSVFLRGPVKEVFIGRTEV